MFIKKFGPFNISVGITVISVCLDAYIL